MAEDCRLHGKGSRSWRWWQKTTDVLVKMSQYWSANEINAVDVLRHTAIIRESSNPPASFPKGVWEYVVTHSSHLTERWSSVHEYTSAGAHTHRQSDKQTHRHQDRRTDSNTRHKYTDTYSTDQRGDRVSRNTPLLVNYVLSWKTITFQHSKQKLWHFLICCPKNCDIETLPNMGLLGRSVWLQVPYAQIWSWTKIYLGIAPWCHPSWPVILSVNNELLSRINT